MNSVVKKTAAVDSKEGLPISYDLYFPGSG